MQKLIEQIKKELKEVGEQGLSANNLESVETMTEILKNIQEVDGMNYRGYNDGGYRTGGYRDGYRDGNYHGDYGMRDMKIYRMDGHDGRMREKLNYLMDGMNEYEYGREHYMHGGSEARLYEGLEKLMYGLCMFVESAMEFAETPQEKEIIRKHIQKLQHI